MPATKGARWGAQRRDGASNSIVNVVRRDSERATFGFVIRGSTKKARLGPGRRIEHRAGQPPGTPRTSKTTLLRIRSVAQNEHLAV